MRKQEDALETHGVSSLWIKWKAKMGAAFCPAVSLGGELPDCMQAIEQATHSEHARYHCGALGDLTNTHLAGEATQAGFLHPNASHFSNGQCVRLYHQTGTKMLFLPNGKRELFRREGNMMKLARRV